MKARKTLTHLLLGFVIFSVGFAAGKEFALRKARGGPGPSVYGSASRDSVGAGSQPAQAGDRLIVYYMHRSNRCVTCNKVEAMTGQVLTADFAEQLSAGRIEWRAVNFEDNEDLARRYDIASSSVVLVDVRAGREKRFARLDEVWEHARDEGRFSQYVRDAVQAYLSEGP